MGAPLESPEIRCTDCDWEGDKADCSSVTDYSDDEFWGVVETTRTKIPTCPECGSEELADIEPEDEDEEA